MTDDQRTPDLDAAIEATVRALTDLSDDAVAASLRRTRLALADSAPRPAGGGMWRWALPAITGATILVALSLWQPQTPANPPRLGTVESRPRGSAAPAAASPERVATTRPDTTFGASTVRPRPLRPIPVREPRPDAVHAAAVRPDPLEALVTAVQGIPNDAWRVGVARASAPVAAAEVAVAPIPLSPIATPPLGDLPAGPFVPGEP
jgi:hypothetical protein